MKDYDIDNITETECNNLTLDEEDLLTFCEEFGKVQYHISINDKTKQRTRRRSSIDNYFSQKNKEEEEVNLIFVIFNCFQAGKLCLDFINENNKNKKINFLSCRWFDRSKDMSIIQQALENKKKTTLNQNYLPTKFLNKAKDLSQIFINDLFELFSFYVSLDSLNELKSLMKLNKSQYSKKNLRKNSDNQKIVLTQANLFPDSENIEERRSQLKSHFVCDFNLKDIHSDKDFNLQERLSGIKGYNIVSILEICNHSYPSTNSLFSFLRIDIFDSSILRIRTPNKEKYSLAVSLCQDLVSSILNDYKIYLISQNSENISSYLTIHKEEYLVNINYN